MSFANDIRKFADKAQIGYNEAVGGALLGLSRSVILMTPVDEGRARGNWYASLSSYPTTTNQRTDPNFQQIEFITDNAAGSVFFLTNNLPYIGKLEFGGYPNPSEGSKTVNGFSTQAPSGMVRVSIENFDQMLKRSASEI